MISIKLCFASTLILAGVEISSTLFLGGILGSCLLLALGVFAYKVYLAYQKQALLDKYAQNKTSQSAALRKYEEVRIFKHTGIAQRIGLLLALLFSFFAINYTAYNSLIVAKPIAIEIPDYDGQFLIAPSTPATPPPPPPAAVAPPPPPPPPSTQVMVTDSKVEPTKIDLSNTEIIYDPSGDPSSTATVPSYSGPSTGVVNPFANVPAPPAPKPVEIVEEIFTVVEQMPRFPGCEDMAQGEEAKKQCADQKMMQWIYGQIKYPAQARDMGIEGTAAISFVVDENGEIKDIQIIKKIGGGCEEEAVRVIKEMAKLPQKWTPGKQRGRAVPVRYTLPVRFKLKS